MSYVKSYYQRRVEEQEKIKAAIQGQTESKPVEAVHTVEVADDIPDSTWNKASIQEWLDKHDIAWTDSMTKKQLLGLTDA
jgi:hypothetical protein